MSDIQCQLAALPVKDGGLGIHSAMMLPFWHWLRALLDSKLKFYRHQCPSSLTNHLSRLSPSSWKNHTHQFQLAMQLGSKRTEMLLARIRPKKIPVLPEIMRACLKVVWLNIFIDCHVFKIILTYITYVKLISFKFPFESNSTQANRRPLI